MKLLEGISEWLRKICLDAGADDGGFVEVGRLEVADERADISLLLPNTMTLISLLCRMNRDNVRPPARSVANLEFGAVLFMLVRAKDVQPIYSRQSPRIGSNFQFEKVHSRVFRGG